MRKVEITWRDSQIYTSQISTSELFDLCVLTSVGYLVSKDKKQLVIARDIVNDTDIRGAIVIPKENVVKLRRLL
jgi:hypothetical protein